MHEPRFGRVRNGGAIAGSVPAMVMVPLALDSTFNVAVIGLILVVAILFVWFRMFIWPSITQH